MGFFNINSPFFQFINRLLDVLVLNILWLICCVPIFTIGASTCAAYSVTLKMVDDEEGYVARMFFAAFKENFKQGTCMWCITAPCLYALYIEWQLVLKSDDANAILIIGVIFSTALVLALNLYAYPLIARYKNSLKNMIKNSFGICLQYFGRSVFIVALVAFEIMLIMWNNVTVLVGILIGPEIIIYTISGIAKRIFKELDAAYGNKE